MTEKAEIIPADDRNVLQVSQDEVEVIKKALNDVREEIQGSPYIKEAIQVLTVKGYRSAIGSYWNAVVDDLRNKILHRSLDLFNREMGESLKREIKSYEDFQEHVTDYILIEGAYKIGVLNWEAKKVLHHARETRHIFDGHPKSSDPTIIKVFDLMIDCNKYVLSLEYPVAVINIDDYIAAMDSGDFMREEMAVEQTLSDLPDIYKTELINKFFTIYQHEATSTTLRSNIEFCSPILWKFLSRENKHQIGQRVDRELQNGQGRKFEQAISFLLFTDGSLRYTSTATRQIVFQREIEALEKSLDSWDVEGRVCRRLEQLGMSIPDSLLGRYIQALTQTYVGYTSFRNYYSWSAAPTILRIFERLDDKAALAFEKTVKESTTLRNRLGNISQLTRLRSLANVLLDKVQPNSSADAFLRLIVDPTAEERFYATIRK